MAEVVMSYRFRSLEEKRELVAAWRASGLPRTRFAHEQALPVSAFCRWVQAFDEEAGTAPKFLPVRVVAPEPRASTALVVELAGVGHRIHVPADFDVAALRRLVGALC